MRCPTTNAINKKAEQKQYSDLVTRLALGGSLSNITGRDSGQPEIAARLLVPI